MIPMPDISPDDLVARRRPTAQGFVAVAAAIVLACVSFAARAGASEGTPFGIASFRTETTEPAAGNVNEPTMFTQAGGHPTALTTIIKFTQEERNGGHAAPTGDPKDIIIDLPPGLVANPQAVPRCSGKGTRCPANTQVGTFTLRLAGGEGEISVLGAIYNIAPYVGQAAEFGLEVPFFGRILLTGRLVRTARGYTLALVGRGLPIFDLASFGNSSPALHLTSMETTLWGVPAAALHDPQRGLLCFGGSALGSSCQGGGEGGSKESTPFLTMPDTCSGEPPTTVAWTDSWQHPGRFVQATSTLPQMGYCDRLAFWPEVVVRPETTKSDAPDGLGISIQVHQFDEAIVAAPSLRAATVTLPQGVAINPAVSDGLEGCQATGPNGINIPTGRNANGEPLTPEEVGPGEEIPAPQLGPEEPQLVPGHCPNASIVGTAEAITPLLPNPIDGHVYLAMPECGAADQGPCTEQDAADGNLFRIFIELGAGANIKRDENEGVLIKLAGIVQASPATGQLSVRLTESPDLPISELNLRLSGGERALLANPTTCGAATTTSDLEPWSAPYTPSDSPTSYFNVTDCAAVPLHPAFLAGTINADAGAASPFTVTIHRSPGEPDLSSLQVQAPPGLSAMLSSVQPCHEALASTGQCPEASRIGSSIVGVGGGPLPLYLPGSVYLTTGYRGAPFGLSIVTNGQAGPLNLGTIVIRARINIDPVTAALTITTDPLPQILLGVPLRAQRISLDIDRPGFMVNPTDCDEKHVTGTVVDVLDETAALSNRYAVVDCKSLAFKPRLVASTTGRTTVTDGADLVLQLTFPPVAPGLGANLARIKLTLPKHLPSRLGTLQGACRQATFSSNPAACPPTSLVGVATAQTPLLKAALTGPVYLITHGPAALPSPVIVLQGEGVTLVLQGTTLINKQGAMSVAFTTIPDLPLSSLRLYLPQGPHSLLSANTSLCGLSELTSARRKVTQRTSAHAQQRRVLRAPLPADLSMPTELAGHNGAVIHTTTKIRVIGCPAKRSNTRAIH